MRISLLAFVFMFAAFAQALPIKRVVAGSTGYVKVYVQPRNGADTDILFVVDNSGSMETYQRQLTANIPVLVDGVRRGGVNMHAAVLTTDADGVFARTTPGYLVANLKSGDPEFTARLSAAMNVGVNGSGIEQPFDSVKLALSEPLLSTVNAGFLRADVPLSIIFVTDAEDQSKISYDDFKAFLGGLKPAGQLSLYSFMAPPADMTCPKDSQDAAIKLETLVNDFGGQIFKICEPSWRAPMQSISEKMLREVTRSIRLPTEPVMSSIEVRYGSVKLTGGDLRRGWVYDETTTSVVIGDDFDFGGQAAGTEIEVKFIPKYWQ